VITVWRIVKSNYARDAFSGEGAARFGGRWNQKGTPVVYTSASAALARLEILVSLESARDLDLFVLIAAEIPDGIQPIVLPQADLPPDWDSFPHPLSTIQIGQRWIQDQQSVALAVPSIAAPEEFNYLLNPNHPDFLQLKIGTAQLIQWDRRLRNRLGS
jgi:RES domain-containing protein